MPKRIQRKRTKGWRAPLCSCGCGKNARYVGRLPSGNSWSNQFAVGAELRVETAFWPENGSVPRHYCFSAEIDARLAVELFRWWTTSRPALVDQIRDELAGHDLMCWCALTDPCHADVLLELANPRAPSC